MQEVPVVLDHDSLSRPQFYALDAQAKAQLVDLCKNTASVPSNHIVSVSRYGEVIFARASTGSTSTGITMHSVLFQRESDGVFRAARNDGAKVFTG